jgi:hypothetical protein
MMGVTYTIVEEKYAHANGFRVGYGIAVRAAGTAEGETAHIQTVHDITSDRARLETLVEACNRLGLSTVHLYDVIADFLAQ